MDIESLMSGIAIVIDDAYENQTDASLNGDPIFNIVSSIEKRLDVPFYTMSQIPEERKTENLLRSASFVLLDWQLWPGMPGAKSLEEDGITKNLEFLKKAKEYFVPVFIFTNASPEDVINHLSGAGMYEQDTDKVGQNFIFVRQKGSLVDPVAKIEDWIKHNASVYALKAWDAEFNRAERNLFSSMYDKNPNWPKMFWRTYEQDEVEPSPQIAKLIMDNLFGRIRLDIFNGEFLGSEKIAVDKVEQDDLRALISEARFIQDDNLLEDEVRAGDIFLDEGKYFINIRPDCDCIPRGNSSIGGVEIYCLEGESMTDADVCDRYDPEYGILNERVTESIVFFLHDRNTIRFKFRKFSIKKFSEMRQKRVGRLIHPYITNIQQRYAFYMQRQGFSRIPKEAVVESDSRNSTEHGEEEEQSLK